MPVPGMLGGRGLLATLRERNLLNPALVSGVAIILCLVLASFIGPALSPYDAETPDPAAALAGPSASHIFGTDSSGFDIFTRVLYAPRIDLTIAAAGIALSLVLGIALGLLAGMSRSFVGELVLRVADVVQAFPLLILALALVALTGNNTSNVIWGLVLVNTPIFLRLLRSRVLTIREQRFIEASVALGNTRRRLLWKHVLPNAIGPVVVQFGISMGYGILILAGLAFLGVGVQAPTPEWGSMILIGRSDITTGQWWTAVFPGLGLALAVFGFNLFSEGVERARELRH
ncbi:MAG: ABC transporter permease [Thermoleophilia bacterium]